MKYLLYTALSITIFISMNSIAAQKSMQDNATYAVTTGGKITKLPQGQIMNQPNAQGTTYAVTTGGRVTELPQGKMLKQPATVGPTYEVTTGGKVTRLP